MTDPRFCRVCGSPLAEGLCAVCGFHSASPQPVITPAAPWRRLPATLIDYLVVSIGFSIVSSPFIRTNDAFQVASSVVTVIYVLILTRCGGTLGNFAMRTRLVHRDRQRPSFSRSLLRSLLAHVSDIALVWCALHHGIPSWQDVLSGAPGAHFPALVYVATIGQVIDCAAAFVTPQRQTLHDWAAGVFLVDRQD